MSKQISMDQIIEATLSGIKKSQQQYEKWSGGFWLWNAPEYFVTTNVANEISKINGPKFITLENGSTAMIKEAGARGRGRLSKDIREKGKVDILLWWGNDRPRAIIEIKNYIYSATQYERDIKRIKALLKLNSSQSSLQFALFAYCDSADNGKQKSAQQKIEDKMSRIKSNVEKFLGNDFYVSETSTNIQAIEESAWCATCILIKQK